MPIYEYQCPKCQHIFEEWTKTIDNCEAEPCPKCGVSSPRVMSQTSFVLKGDGWYVSDYGYRKGVKEEDGTPPKSDDQAVASDTSASPDASSDKKSSEASSNVSPDTSKSVPETVKPKTAAGKEKSVSATPKSVATGSASGKTAQAS